MPKSTAKTYKTDTSREDQEQRAEVGFIGAMLDLEAAS